MIKHAILTQPYSTRIGPIFGGKDITLPVGTKLVYASNLPAGSRIFWWVDELPKVFEGNDFVEGWHRNYGIGLEGDAVFLPNYTSPAPEAPARLD